MIAPEAVAAGVLEVKPRAPRWPLGPDDADAGSAEQRIGDFLSSLSVLHGAD